MATESTDKELVKRVQKGDKGAFDLLVLKYEQKIVNLVMRYVRDPEQALDITQEAFIKAYRALPRFRGDSAFYTWLYRIAVNTAKNYLVAHIKQKTANDIDVADAEYLSNGSELQDIETPESSLFRDELEQTVDRAIRALPEDLKTAVTLREYDGLSYEEIAEVMECPVGTVRSRIFRARETVSEKLRALSDLQARGQ